MSRRVTIVMYHFVRDLRRSRYPTIKGLDAEDFAGQIEYALRHHHVVRMEDVLGALRDPAVELPERALLLTFDDGYADHYQTVFPLLDALGLQGSFFPPASAVMESRVLDVNKIHFLLAAADDVQGIVRAMEQRIEAARQTHPLPPSAQYRERYARPNRWDTAEVIYVKRVLQKGLPQPLRASITDDLFREFVAHDEAAFARELYLTLDQLRCMVRHGMYVGGHGSDHVWLDTLDPAALEREVRGTTELLRQVGVDLDRWVMCYPYGAHDAQLHGVLAANGCLAGLTTDVAIADLDRDVALALPRIDTNDLPVRPDAPPSEWTQRAGAAPRTQASPRSKYVP